MIPEAETRPAPVSELRARILSEATQLFAKKEDAAEGEAGRQAGS